MSCTFLILVGNYNIYEKYFLSSPLFNRKFDFQILAQSGFKTASQAYNNGIEKAQNDLIVCAHQDVVLPATWATQFLANLAKVESLGVPVGVVGCWGATLKNERAGHVYHRDRQLFPHYPLPAQVQTLDELLISFRKSSGLRFDPALPSFFGYAVDLCLQAHSRGLQNFAVDAPCVHQTIDQKRIRKGLFESWVYLLHKWRDVLPVHTPSGTLDSKWSLWMDRIKPYIFDMIGYSPHVWWKDLPQVNLQEILFADAIPPEKREVTSSYHRNSPQTETEND